MDWVPIIVAVIAALSSVGTGILTLVGIIVTSIVSIVVTNKKTELELDKKQAITDVKFEELTREVREHNNFAKRMPVVEEQIRVLSDRISAVESKIK